MLNNKVVVINGGAGSFGKKFVESIEVSMSIRLTTDRGAGDDRETSTTRLRERRVRNKTITK